MTASKECIAQWISTLHHEDMERSDKEIVALAYKQCGAHTKDFSPTDFCPFHILAKDRFKDTFLQNLPSDFVPLPKSLLISKAVDLALPLLKHQFTDYSEVDLLKMAYRLAQDALSVNDFETIEQKPIYFAIQIPHEDLEQFETELRNAAYYFPDNITDFTEDATKFFAPEQGVASSNVAEVGYDRNKLRVFFNNGGGYEYDVPASFFGAMMSAPSKGKFVWEHLRGHTPGRVIDNPNKITPGGVGGSIVPYFKIKGGAMSQQQMASSVRSFLKATRKGKGEVGGVPIQQIDRPTFKAFDKFVKGFQTPKERVKTFFSRLVPPKSSKTKSKAKESAQSPLKPSQSSKSSSSTTPKKKGRKQVTKSKRPFKKTKQMRSTEEKLEGRIRALQSYQKRGSKSKYEKKEEALKENKTEEREDLQKKLRDLKKKLKRANELKQQGQIKSLKAQIARIMKKLDGLSDFAHHYTNDFMEDMRYFRGPISRAGPFDYGDVIKYKNMENLSEQANNTHHLPVFDSHQENQIIGFAYNLTDDPDLYMKDHQDYEKFKTEPYLYGEGYLLDEIEEYSNLTIKKDETKLPVSIKFDDANEGIDSEDQQITRLIHLAMSVNATEQDRCSTASGQPCWVSFTNDFLPKEETTMPKEKEGKDEEDDSEEQDREDEDFSEDAAEEKKKMPEEQDLASTEKDGDMVKISKEEYNQLQDMKTDAEKTFDKLKADFKKAVKEEVAGIKKELKRNQDFKEMKEDFNDDNKIYKISANFKKEATAEDYYVLKKALVQHEEDFDPSENLGFGRSHTSKAPKSDFAKRIDATRAEKRKQWELGF